VVRTLGEAKLTDRARIIMEKPFGTDLPTARHLNGVVQETFDDDQVFRIDHFLGKEAAQNILAFRFANGLFEPTWNREHIDHIQIDVPEALSVGKSGAFYEQTGAFRDMVVTHLFQNRKVGDVEQLGSNGPRLRVDALDPERTIVLHSEDGNWIWAFCLHPDGEGRTRLVSRNRIGTPDASPCQRAFGTFVMEPGSPIMERKMLLGIKRRAERPVTRGTGEEAP
jgi:hypothetical protein